MPEVLTHVTDGFRTSGSCWVNIVDPEGKLITETLLHLVGDCITPTLSIEWLIPGALISTTQTSPLVFFRCWSWRPVAFCSEPRDEGAVEVQTGNSFWDQYMPFTAGHRHFILPADCYYLRISFCGSGPFLSINAAFSQPAIRSLLRLLLSGWAAALHLLITGASRLPQRNHYPSKNVALDVVGFCWVSFSSWQGVFLFVWRL